MVSDGGEIGYFKVGHHIVEIDKLLLEAILANVTGDNCEAVISLLIDVVDRILQFAEMVVRVGKNGYLERPAVVGVKFIDSSQVTGGGIVVTFVEVSLVRTA